MHKPVLVASAMAKETTFTGADLALWRAERELTQADLNPLVGISRNTIIKYERDDLELPLTERLALGAYDAGVSPVTRQPRAKRR